MPHAASLIATVVVSMVFAFGLGLLASRLRLPPLLGYLLAGVAVGPFTPGFVADAALAAQLAEIGVVLLMFGVGLHFSIRDLLAVYPIAVPGALGQLVVSLAAGAGLGIIWGWGLDVGLLLGLALSVASTVVLLRVLDERGALNSARGRIAIGWLIVQDLAMVLVLVVLPPLAGRQGGTEAAIALALTLGKVTLFVALVVVGGQRFLPWLLGAVARAGSRELFTLAVLACALGIAYGSAELFGVSLALGAFFAGVVLSESDLSHQAAANSLPLQDAFAVLFFVSVGMLFDPSILVREPLRVMTVLLVILLVKSLPAVAVVLFAGYPLKSALAVAAGLAQVGEFSFILAGLGVGLGLLPPEGRDLIIAGALLSITLNPLLYNVTDKLAEWLQARPATLARFERPAALGLRDRTARSSHGLKGHAVLVGYGRVGGLIGQALIQQGLPFVIVEQDWRLVEELRARRLSVVWGGASAPIVLEAAEIAAARLLILAIPDGGQTRRVLEAARNINPAIDAVVRTHTDSDLAYLERQGVGMAVMGEREMALTMASYALQRLGVSDEAARTVGQQFRTLARAGIGMESPLSAEPRGVPELQRRQALEEGDNAPETPDAR